MNDPAAPRVPGSRWFRLAAWMSILTAIGHTVGNHGPQRPPPPPEQARVLDAMGALVVRMPGNTHHTLLDFFVGDSLSLGLFVLAFGLTNLLFERALRRRGEAVPEAVLAVNFAVTAVSMIIAVRCFPIQPLIGLGVALVGYAMAWLRSRGHRRAAAPGTARA
jgi:hypothetical protein